MMNSLTDLGPERDSGTSGPEHGRAQMITAVAEAEPGALEALLSDICGERPQTINRPSGSRGYTLLHDLCAASARLAPAALEAAVSAAIRAGADPAAESTFGVRPLYLVVPFSAVHLGTVRLLLPLTPARAETPSPMDRLALRLALLAADTDERLLDVVLADEQHGLDLSDSDAVAAFLALYPDFSTHYSASLDAAKKRQLLSAVVVSEPSQL